MYCYSTRFPLAAQIRTSYSSDRYAAIGFNVVLFSIDAGVSARKIGVRLKGAKGVLSLDVAPESGLLQL